MDEFIVIKVMNNAKLELNKNKNRDYSQNEKIKKYLEDEAFFFKISKDIALKILNLIGVHNSQLNITYDKLVNENNFYKLKQKGIIKDTDKLIIKY